MATLKIFGDEAGTMPENENDGPFVVSIIGTIGDFPSIDFPTTPTSKWLAEALKAAALIPFTSYVIPVSGYYSNFVKKRQEMDKMSQVTLRRTKANAKWVGEKGFNPRNHVWCHCINQAVIQIVIAEAIKEEIERIDIFLDEKSLSNKTKTYLSDMLRDKVKEIINNNLTQVGVQTIKDKLAFTRETVFLHWIPKNDTSEASDGVKLADLLASKIHRDMRRANNPDNPNIKQLLATTGFKDCFQNFTKILLGPLSPEIIETWERMTGYSFNNLRDIDLSSVTFVC